MNFLDARVEQRLRSIEQEGAPLFACDRIHDIEFADKLLQSRISERQVLGDVVGLQLFESQIAAIASEIYVEVGIACETARRVALWSARNPDNASHGTWALEVSYSAFARILDTNCFLMKSLWEVTNASSFPIEESVSQHLQTVYSVGLLCLEEVYLDMIRCERYLAMPATSLDMVLLEVCRERVRNSIWSRLPLPCSDVVMDAFEGIPLSSLQREQLSSERLDLDGSMRLVRDFRREIAPGTIGGEIPRTKFFRLGCCL